MIPTLRHIKLVLATTVLFVVVALASFTTSGSVDTDVSAKPASIEHHGDVEDLVCLEGLVSCGYTVLHLGNDPSVYLKLNRDGYPVVDSDAPVSFLLFDNIFHPPRFS
jgi:hypothetical protein